MKKMNEYLNDFEQALIPLREKWKKISDDEVNYRFPIPEISAKEMFLAQVKKHPDKVFIYRREERCTYAECNAAAVRLANRMLELGIRKGDRVITFLTNSVEFIELTHACFKIGAILVNTNPRCTEDEALRRIEDCAPRLALVDSVSMEAVSAAFRQYGKEVMLFSCPAEEPVGPADGIAPWEDLFSDNDTEPVCTITGDDILVLQYTGGTTGVMKGCCQTNHAIVAKALAQMEYFKPILTEQDKENYMVMIGLGMSHAFGFAQAIIVNLSFGGSIYLAETLHEILGAIERYKPTVWPSVPVWIKTIAYDPEYQKYDITSLKCITCGAAPLPVEVISRVESVTGAVITEGYGMTETVNTITINSFKARKPGTVGVPNPNIEYLVVDKETGTQVMPLGKAGEIICRGDCVTKGYWNKPAETAETIRNGWLYTGDIGVVDADGYLSIIDRKKDMIIVSGFNVYPRELEDVVMTLDGISDACAIGIPDPRKGEVPAIYYQLAKGSRLTETDVRRYCEEKLSRFKLPKLYRELDEIPKTKNRKPDRRRLKQLYREEFCAGETP